MPQKNSNLGVILLGAQTFPLSDGKFDSSTAFLTSKNKILNYFTDTDGFNLDKGLVKDDLFDTDKGANDIDIAMRDFITELKAKNISDLVIYYVGHGTLTKNSGFILALKTSRFGSLDFSSISFRNLASSLLNVAGDFRIYFILDCCFAGAAVGGFQSDIPTTIKVQFETEFAKSGVALLCASSKSLPALIIEERNVTMFTEGLEKALRSGDKAINYNLLNLYDLQDIALSHIRENNQTDFVRPEVHAPDQKNGDVGENRFFPNYAYSPSAGVNFAYDMDSRFTALQNVIMVDDLQNVTTQFLSFIKDFDKEHTKDSILLITRFNMDESKQRSGPDGGGSTDKDSQARRLQLYDAILEMAIKLWMNKAA